MNRVNKVPAFSNFYFSVIERFLFQTFKESWNKQIVTICLFHDFLTFVLTNLCVLLTVKPVINRIRHNFSRLCTIFWALSSSRSQNIQDLLLFLTTLLRNRDSKMNIRVWGLLTVHAKWWHVRDPESNTQWGIGLIK